MSLLSTAKVDGKPTLGEFADAAGVLIADLESAIGAAPARIVLLSASTLASAGAGYAIWLLVGAIAARHAWTTSASFRTLDLILVLRQWETGGPRRPMHLFRRCLP